MYEVLKKKNETKGLVAGEVIYDNKQIRKALISSKSNEHKEAENNPILFNSDMEVGGQTTNHTGIPTQLKSDFEAKSGFFFDDVRVHYNSNKPAQFHALAYTQGNQVYIEQGQEKHLIHELVHVEQQKRGIVKPTTYMDGIPVNNDAKLEYEAKNRKTAMNHSNCTGKNNIIVQRWQPTLKDLQKRLPGLPEIIGKAILEVANKYNSSKIEGFTEDSLGIVEFFLSLYRKVKHLTFTDMEIRFTHIIHKIYPLSKVEIAKSDYTEVEMINVNAFNKIEDTLGISTLDFNIDIPDSAVQKDKDGIPIHCATLSFQKILDSLEQDDVPKVQKCIVQLIDICGWSGMKKTVEGANINVTSALLDNNTSTPFENTSTFIQNERKIASMFFTKRLMLMTDFLSTTKKNNKGFWDGTFKMESSGSDPHALGKHAILLNDAKTSKTSRVYKPRSTKADQALTGKSNSIISYVNTLLKPNEQLQTMEFYGEHEEEFVQKVGTKKDPVEVTTAMYFFKKLGMLHILSTVLGITDLHTDNIIFTQNGPIIVDAECSFADFSGSLIESEFGSLKRSLDSASMGAAASLYYIKDPNIAKTPITSVEAYKYPKYFECYEAGKFHMINTIFDSDKFVGNISKIIENIDKIRIVPISTNEFGKYPKSYKQSDENIKKTATESIVKDIVRELGDEKWVFTNKEFNVVFDENKIYESLIAAFDNGTIPAFELDMDLPGIRLDGNIITTTFPNKQQIILNYNIKAFNKIITELIKLFKINL